MAHVSSLGRRHAALLILLPLIFALTFSHSFPRAYSQLAGRFGFGDADSFSEEEAGHPAGKVNLFARDDDPYSCSKDKPCGNKACCGKSGVCGYGPTYCGDGCFSNCDAKAECGQYAEEGHEKCPLNVCCSQYGFCGTLKEYCDDKCQSNCGEPSLPDGKSKHPVRDRVIAYYEAWSARRKCNPFQPAQIPTSALTHVNFAFAYIEPGSFEITTMDSQTPETLFDKVTAIKSMKNGLGNPVEVWVAIGGWTFSDNDTATQPLFGEISSSEENRQTFADNLVGFMTGHGFDGVDLDWEYPGAPDRGGNKEQDTKNFVKLIATLRKTFDRSPRGGYGLSFTIPSSYWYLRWFDVPGMLEAGASWVNLMSYDLHGVWDKHNAIGSIVQSHTNLTEIKESVALLWRNNVPPGKVVLGAGFYGRSFQLSDPSCNKPGCKFEGAARKGECTNEGGILGYFEIQDILKQHKINKIHDKEAAVNYFTFDKDQWVSYDDATTFEQKVKWADSIGLGGLMIWAVDLDDDKFSALSGLIGKDVGEGIDKTTTIGSRVGDSWSSDNGEDCYSTKCGERCPKDMATLETYKSSCGKNTKYICCPRDRTPRDCAWRGGEKGSACHGQCHEGELRILLDGHGSKSCSSGQQAFCCTSERFKKLLEGCKLGDCDGSCPSGTHEVAKQSCGKPIKGKKAPWCCKTDIKNCHWVGKGNCDQNNCDSDDVQLSRHERGDGKWACGMANRQKVLCCDAPNDIDPYTPVPLEYLFPDPPPVDASVKFDVQVLGSFSGSGAETTPDNLDNDPTYAPFGFILIAGPKDVVSSISKRDDSHIEVVDCSSITSEGPQTVRIFCTDDSDSSNCDDMLEGGLDGTILRMPDNCGPGTYVVAHSLKPSEDQVLPSHLAEKMPVGKSVMDLEFSYDFNLVKRSDKDVLLRIDWSNMPGYWDSIVDEPGVKRKRSLHPRDLKQKDINKRFFSDDSADWAPKLEKLRGQRAWTDFSESAEALIVNDKIKCSDGGWLEIKSDGRCDVRAKFGFTMIGTFSPFSIDQVYGFLDMNYELDADITVSGHSGLDTPYTPKKKPTSAHPGMTFNHPGLVKFSPNFDIFVGIDANDASFSGEFKTHVNVKSDPNINDGWIRRTFPSTAGKASGGLVSSNHNFKGHMKTSQGSVDISLRPNLQLALDIDNNNPHASKRDVQDLEARKILSLSGYRINYYSPVMLHWDDEGVNLMTDALQYAMVRYTGGAFDDWAAEETSGKSMGRAPGIVRLHKQSDSEDDDAPAYEDNSSRALFDSDNLTCPVEDDCEDNFDCNANLCQSGDENCGEESTNVRGGSRSSSGLEDRHKNSNYQDYHPISAVSDARLDDPASISKLFERDPTGSSGSKDYEAKCLSEGTGSEQKFTYTSPDYPSPGQWSYDDKRWEEAYNAPVHDSCTDGGIDTHIVVDMEDVTDDDPRYCCEHIVERQTMKLFFGDIRENILFDGAASGLPQIYCEFIKALKTNLLENGPPLDGLHPSEVNISMARIMWAHGTGSNFERFVFLEENINVQKEVLWGKSNPRRITASDYKKALKKVRYVFNVFSYLKHPTVNKYWAEICNLVRNEFKRADEAWMKNHDEKDPAKRKTRPSTKIVDYWDKWVRNQQNHMVTKGKDFATGQLSSLEDYWHDLLVSNDPCEAKTASEVLLKVAKLKKQLNDGIVSVKLDLLDS